MSVTEPKAGNVAGEEIVSELSDKGVEGAEDNALIVHEEKEVTEVKTEEAEEKKVTEVKTEEAEEKKESLKVDAETRVQEALKAAREANERAAKVEKEFAETRAALEEQKRPFVDLTLEQVSNVVTNARAEITLLEEEGRSFEAELAKHRLTQYIEFVKANEEKRTKFQTEQQQREAARATAAKDRTDMESAAEFYRDKMKYPKEMWEDAGKEIAKYFEANPIKGRAFAELMVKREFISAISFADKVFHDDILPVLEGERKKKEAGKIAVVSSGGNAGAKEKTLAEIAETGTMAEYIAARSKKK